MWGIVSGKGNWTVGNCVAGMADSNEALVLPQGTAKGAKQPTVRKFETFGQLVFEKTKPHLVEILVKI